MAAIVALRPDLVVVDREENRREDAAALTDAGVRVHVTHVVSISDVAPTLDDLARAVGVEPDPVVMPSPAERWASAFVPIWRRPWMTLNDDTYGSSVLAHLGVANVFADAPERYPAVDLDAVAERRPDLVLLPTEPYPFRAVHAEELRALVPRADVRIVDGQDLFWWGGRTRVALERLRAALRAAPPPP